MSRNDFVRTIARPGAFVAAALALSLTIGAACAYAQNRKLHVDAFASPATPPIANIEPARWVCSPSGFGQTSTCTLRAGRFFGG